MQNLKKIKSSYNKFKIKIFDFYMTSAFYGLIILVLFLGSYHELRIKFNKSKNEEKL